LLNKRYQVFVSSTYDDLKEERKEVIQALLELECIPSGMELFSAANDAQWTLIKEVIDECDYYVVILAGRYGSIGPDGESYTEMEYKYALSKNKPIVAFLHEDISTIPQKKSETDQIKREKLEQFRTLTKQKMCKFWSTPDALGAVVSRGLTNLIRRNPAIGWVRSDDISDPEMSKENLTLRKRIDQLESELNSIGTVAPKDIEDLAQGDDVYELKFKITIRDVTDALYGYEEKVENYKIKSTWNEIIKSVIPQCMPESDERGIAEAIQIKLRTIPEKSKKMLDTKKYELFRNQLTNSSLREVIIQLKALGIIISSSNLKKRNLGDNSKYWALSKYGEPLMDKLCAIHKTPQ